MHARSSAGNRAVSVLLDSLVERRKLAGGIRSRLETERSRPGPRRSAHVRDGDEARECASSSEVRTPCISFRQRGSGSGGRWPQAACSGGPGRSRAPDALPTRPEATSIERGPDRSVVERVAYLAADEARPRQRGAGLRPSAGNEQPHRTLFLHAAEGPTSVNPGTTTTSKSVACASPVCEREERKGRERSVRAIPGTLGMGVPTEAVRCALIAAAVASPLAVFGPPPGDLPAHLYRTELVREGVLLWDTYWYAGHYPLLSYSLLYYFPAALVGNEPLAIAAVIVSAALFASLVERGWGPETRWASRAFAVAACGPLFTGTYPYAVGVAAGLGALKALQSGRTALAIVARRAHARLQPARLSLPLSRPGGGLSRAPPDRPAHVGRRRCSAPVRGRSDGRDRGLPLRGRVPLLPDGRARRPPGAVARLRGARHARPSRPDARADLRPLAPRGARGLPRGLADRGKHHPPARIGCSRWPCSPRRSPVIGRAGSQCWPWAAPSPTRLSRTWQ